jgi:biopolymer transport protein ExbD
MSKDVQHALEDDDSALNTTINTTPLVDVMLVLLVIFLVTIPVVVQNIDLKLPNYRNVVTVTKPENIVIAVDVHNNVYFKTQPIDINQVEPMLLAANKAVTNGIYPEVHIRGDRQARFQTIGRILQAAQRAGIAKVGFLTEPHVDQQ